MLRFATTILSAAVPTDVPIFPSSTSSMPVGLPGGGGEEKRQRLADAKVLEATKTRLRSCNEWLSSSLAGFYLVQGPQNTKCKNESQLLKWLPL